jgi:hypothetical protein
MGNQRQQAVFSVDGWYIAVMMRRIESSLAILHGLWALLAPHSFLLALCAHFAKDSVLLHPVSLLLSRMVGNGMLMAGLCKIFFLRPSVAVATRQAFVYLEVLVKAMHLVTTCAFLLLHGLANFGSVFNIVLGAGQMLAVLLTAQHELTTRQKAHTVTH